MRLLEALVQYGVANGILLGDGEDTYRDFMPEAPDFVVVFAEYLGAPVSQYAGCVHRSVQVKVRDTSADSAHEKIVELFKLFTSSSEDLRINFTDTIWGQVYVRQPPFKLEQDRSDRTIYCFNLGITTDTIE